MSKEYDADDISESDEQTDSINRRRFVKSLSVAGGAAAFGALGSGRVSAKNGDSSPSKDMRLVHGEQADKRIKAAQKTSKFQKLQSYLDKKYNQTTEIDTAQVAKIHAENDAPFHLVSFKTNHTDPTDEESNTQGNAVVTLQNGSTTASGLLQYLADGKPTRIVKFNVLNGVVQEQSSEVSDLKRNLSTEGSSSVHIEASLDCSACKLLFQTVCALGCSIGVHALCVAAFGLGGIPGGAACVLTAGAICTYIGNHPRACRRPARRNCHNLGHCP